MPYEKGGRADKYGNRYENKWVIYQLLRVIDEKAESIIIEPIGEDEAGVDIWVNEKDGSREAQQCKGRNASKESWDTPSLKSRGIIAKSRQQLDRNPEYKFALVSPISCTMLFDLTTRARNSSKVKDFLEYQVMSGTSPEFQAFFISYCNALGLDYSNDNDLIKIVDYLKRTYYHQYLDSRMQKEELLDKIKFLFIGDSNNIYNLLENYILEEDVLGKEISCVMIGKLLKENSIYLRDLAKDTRIFPRIYELNMEFKDSFCPISKTLSERKEFEICRNEIKQGNSLVIHGRAGSGKSGCAQALSLYCETNSIPYIAIKLDKKIPSGSLENFSNQLGLPASVVYCLDCISKNKIGMIILDQLDALRWTQNHSRNALDICGEVIREVNNINREREHKLSLVFICRSYDLDNDKNIKMLFKDTDENEDIKWIKVQVGELEEDYVKKVIGDIYSQLSKKLRDALRVSSNLYIWEQLDKTQCYDEFTTANDLISEWWRQLCLKSHMYNINEVDIKSLKDNLILLLQNNNKLFVNKKLLDCTHISLEYLISFGMLINSVDKISFVHQSIYDYFLVENMLIRIYGGDDIENIVGIKERQTPGKRYQIQMLLQLIEEDDADIFIDVGERILNSVNIRFYIKYVFLEVLGQCNILTERIKHFLHTNLENEKFINHILDNIIGHNAYVEFLIDEGYIDKWFLGNGVNKLLAIKLLTSISKSGTTNLVEIIRKYAFTNREDDMLLIRCFNNYVTYDSNEMYKLRIEFYEKYPDMINAYLNVKELFKNNAERAISILELMLRHKKKTNGEKVYQYEEEFINEYTEVIVDNGEAIIDKLLPYVPLSKDYYSDWSSKYYSKRSIERACMSILKKAITTVIKQIPLMFIDKFQLYFGKGYVFINELILHGFEKMPVEYSDMVIDTLMKNPNKNIFDYTSGNGDELGITKNIIRKHSIGCSEICYKSLENKLYFFQEDNAINIYKRKRNWNKENGKTEYWPYWGEVQANLLPFLPTERVSLKAKELICVLTRKFNGRFTLHSNKWGQFGSVSSPIDGKVNELSNKQWKQILISGKIQNRNNFILKETKGGYVECSIEQFARSFNSAVSNNPGRFVDFILKMNETIPDIYIDELFSGLAYGENRKSVPLQLLEPLILKYKCDNYSHRASSICHLIKDFNNERWSDEVIELLISIALNHTNPEEEKVNDTSADDKEMISLQMLISNSMNCVRGRAAETIGLLIWGNADLYLAFKNTVEKLVNDVNSAVKMASIECLCPIYKIDPEWSSGNILKLFIQDYRIAGHHSSIQMVYLLYNNYKEEIEKVILSCYYSEGDAELMRLGAHFITELYFRHGEFYEEIFNIDKMNAAQANGIIEMTVVYFQFDEFVEKCKKLLKIFFSSDKDLEHSFSGLFYDKRIDIKRDYEFLLDMMQSKLNMRIVYAFAHYLEESSGSLEDFSSIIIKMSKSILTENVANEESFQNSGIDDDLSKLIAALYDETSQSENENRKYITQECLNIWDLMFEKRIGSARSLSKQILER